MNKFIVEIPNERSRAYRLINFIILILNFFVFGVVFMKSADRTGELSAVAGLVINGVATIFFLLNKRHLRRPFLPLNFLLDAILWLMIGALPLCLLMCFVAVLCLIAERPLRIIFSDAGIEYPSFPVKRYAWNAVSQVLMKDGLLTIDLTDNRIIQLVPSIGDAHVLTSADFRDFIKKVSVAEIASRD